MMVPMLAVWGTEKRPNGLPWVNLHGYDLVINLVSFDLFFLFRKEFSSWHDSTSQVFVLNVHKEE